ncbi:MAG TPA: VWA domain-containing protein [Mariprofundaceae bacterium]|nr:VWA domain-containing protein [Mariprofundaceae bacterium]
MNGFTQWASLAVEQFNWREPDWLYLLPLVLLGMLWWRSRVRLSGKAIHRLRRYADARFWPLVVQGVKREELKREPDIGGSMMPWFAAALILVALAGPRWLHEQQNIFREGSDIAVVMDISSSMDAKDVPPSRLIRAKEELRDFFKRLHGDRVALVVFAGRAFTIAPLTTDYSAMIRFADQLEPEMVTEQGSNLASGLLQGLDALKDARGHGRAVVLLTDGEDHAHARSLAAAAKLDAADVPLFILGIGTSKGGLVPAGHGRFVHDSHGRAVLSRLREAHLKSLAQEAGGVYARIRWDDSDWDALYTHGIRDMVSRSRTASKARQRWHEEYGWLLFPAMLLFGLWWRRSFRQWLS